jgi:N-acyl-D-aspartate/D-glutamate deacylase
MLDCKIVGGSLIDGTGAPRRRADVAIKGSRIVGVGEVDEAATRTIDATGLVVTPGFVDLHTHYDAQLLWDPAATPSPFHGVTTIVGGNCGFTIAPLEESESEYLMTLLARVEGMPIECLVDGPRWDWRSFGDYLDRLDGKLAVNAGFLVGHSAIRRVVMGPESGQEASDAQIEAMERILHRSLAAGGLGFSSSKAPTHNAADGRPVPSRSATHDELVALARVVGRHEGTTLELIPAVGAFSEEHMQLMTDMSVAADRPLNWNLLAVSSDQKGDGPAHQLSASDHAAARGGRVIALAVADPVQLRLSFRTGFILDAIPGWGETMALPPEEKKAALCDPEERRRLAAAARSPEAGIFRSIAQWEPMVIAETFAPENEGVAGRTVEDVARERGQDPFDALVDIVVADDLRTGLVPPLAGDDDESWRMRADIWRDPRVVIGASDAGAHLDLLATFNYTTSLVGPSVRDRGLLPLEEAVRLITDVPARLYGLRHRGQVTEGWFADLVVMDEERVAPDPVKTRFDMPGGAGRLYGEAQGIEHVIVNGTEIIEEGKLTGAEPGTLLRSGRDTDTVVASVAS